MRVEYRDGWAILSVDVSGMKEEEFEFISCLSIGGSEQFTISFHWIGNWIENTMWWWWGLECCPN